MKVGLMRSLGAPARRDELRMSWWITTVVVLTAVLTAAGAIIALVDPTLLLSANEPMNRAAHVYAGYLVSRDLALAAALIGPLVARARQLLAGALLLTAAIQILDILVDSASGRVVLVPGLVVLTILLLYAGFRVWAQPGPAGAGDDKK